MEMRRERENGGTEELQRAKMRLKKKLNFYTLNI